MDKEFLRQIDQANELLADSKPDHIPDDVLICECFCVSALDIRNVCSELGMVDVDLLQETMDLGRGCQSCLKRIDSWVNNIF